MKKTAFFFFLLYCFEKCNSQDWVSMPEEVNGLVNHLNVFKDKLIAGGHFNKAGATQTNKIAEWDGVNWSALGKGVSGGFNPFVFKTLSFNNELYVIGNFDTAGTVGAMDIAKWDGTNWSSLGKGTHKNAALYSIAVYNNQIHVGGEFDSIGGIAARRIARWDGQNWHALGTGLQNNSTNDLYVYKNELYAVGASMMSAGGVPAKYIARWNGTNWNNVGQGLGMDNNALYEWEGKLIIGSELKVIQVNGPNGWQSKYLELVHQWDGNNLTIFSSQDRLPDMTAMLTHKNRLYSARAALVPGASEKSFVTIWDETDSLWKMHGSGINNRVETLCEYNGELYCGGFFEKSTGAKHNYLAKWSLTADIKEIKNADYFISLFPNPASNYLYIQSKSPELTLADIEIINLVGKRVYEQKNIALQQTNTINISDLNNGVYFVRLTSGQNSFTQKVIINR